MALNRLLGEKRPTRDLAVGASQRDLFGDLELATGERRDALPRGSSALPGGNPLAETAKLARSLIPVAGASDAGSSRSAMVSRRTAS